MANLRLFGMRNLFEARHYVTDNVYLIAIVLLGAFLRIYNADFQSYWLDELFSAKMSDPEVPFLDVYHSTVADVHPPAYQLILWGWYKLFGYTTYSGRVLSVLFGVLLVPAIYALGRELFSREVGLLASFLAAVNYFLVVYSQETRPYALLALLTVLSFLFFTKLIRNKDRSALIYYAVSSSLLINVHYFGFLPILVQVPIFLYYIFHSGFDRGLFRCAYTSGAVITVAGIHLVGPIVKHAGMESFWIKKPVPGFVVEYFDAYFAGAHIGLIMAWLVMFAFAVLVFEKRYGRAVIILFSWIAFSLLLPYIRSIASVSLLTPRNTIIVLPAILILAAFSISKFSNGFLKGAVVVLILALSVTTLMLEKNTTPYPIITNGET